MLFKNNTQDNNGPKQGSLWFAILCVAWLQLSSAAHELDHVAEQNGDSCEVCVKFDRTDDVATDHPSAAALAPGRASHALLPVAEEADRELNRNFDSRAPPQL